MAALLIPLFTTVGLTVTAATVAANVAVAAISMAASYGIQAHQAAQARRKQRRQSAGQEQRQSFRASVSPRARHYGTVRVSGLIAFIENRGNDVFIVIVTGSGTIDGFDRFALGSRYVETNAEGQITTAPYWVPALGNSFVRIESRRGYADQPAFDLIGDAFPQWTAAHQLKGCSAVAALMGATLQRDFQSVYEGTIPDVGAVLRGALVWDARDNAQDPDDPATWLYSENPALCLYDYLVHVDGAGLSRDAVDLDSFLAVADICDEPVPLKAGGTEPRYRVATSYTFDEAPADVAQRILDSFRGEMYVSPLDGRIAVRAVLWQDPEHAITADEIVSLSYERGSGLVHEYNAIKPMYISTAHDWREVECDVKEIASSVALLGRAFVEEAHYPTVQSCAQAQRLAKMELFEDNPAYTGEITCHLTALRLMGEAVFRLSLPDDGLDLVCRITSLDFDPAGATVRIGWRSTDPAGFDWVPAVDEADAPAIPEETGEAAAVPGAPTDIIFTTENLSGTWKTGVRWSAPVAAASYEVRWRLNAGDWQLISAQADDYLVIDPVSSGDSLDIEVRLRTALGGISAWTTAAYTVAAFTATSIAPPLDLAVGSGPAIAAPILQCADAEAWAIEWLALLSWESVSWASPRRVVCHPGEAVTLSAALADGVYDIRARAVSLQSGLISSVLGPVAFTVTNSPTSGAESGAGDYGDDASPGGGSIPAGGLTGGSPRPY